jgi:Catalase
VSSWDYNCTRKSTLNLRKAGATVVQRLAPLLLFSVTVSGTLARGEPAALFSEVVPEVSYTGEAQGSQAQGKTELSEDEAIRRIKELTEAQVQDAYRSGQRPAQRDAHAKQHGCVRASFTVSASLPSAMRQGVFAEAHTFHAWVRFSNAVGSDDHAGLARGMAIKLVGVPGRKILPDEADATTQDFLLVNYPVFNVRTAADYVDFLTKSNAGQLPAFFRAHPESERITAAIAAQAVGNPLLQRYFSMTPYALGSSHVKYSAKPVSCTTGETLHDEGKGAQTSDPDYLRAAMTASLANSASCFSFMVQRQTDPSKMPIDDSTVLWSEDLAPFVEVASITIPQQRFDSAEQQAFCENLSYTPWHALPAHQPLGMINRIRRVVYDSVSSLRHRLNGVPRKEPTGDEHFPGSSTW